MSFESLVLNASHKLSLSVLDLKDLVNKHVTRDNGLPTGLLALDAQLNGGIPDGRVIDIFGDYGTGKSTSALAFAGVCNSLGRPVLWQDVENCFDKDWAVKFGVEVDNPDLFKCSRPDTGEDCFRQIRRLLKSWPKPICGWTKKASGTKNICKYVGDECDGTKKDYVDCKCVEPTDDGVCKHSNRTRGPLIVVDSIAALCPELVDSNDEKNPIGIHAKMLSDQFRAVKGLVGKTRSILLVINQTRMSPMAYGNPEIEPGGQAVKFYPDIKLRMGCIGRSKADELGWYTAKFKVMKAKHCKPFGVTEQHFLMDEGFDPVWDTLQYLLLTGQVTKEHGKFSTNWQHKGNEEEGYKYESKEFQEWLIEMRDKCRDQIDTGKFRIYRGIVNGEELGEEEDSDE